MTSSTGQTFHGLTFIFLFGFPWVPALGITVMNMFKNSTYSL